jgi:hypothetical protein
VWTGWGWIKEGTVCCSCAVLRWKLTRRILCWKAEAMRFLGSEVREEVDGGSDAWPLDWAAAPE